MPLLDPLEQSLASRPVVTETGGAAARLFELSRDLQPELFSEVMEVGLRARHEATPSHAVTAAGSYQWHANVPALREPLQYLGWTRKDPKNCPIIISPDRSVAIAVMTGDEDTGNPDGIPSNRSKKGKFLEEQIKLNNAFNRQYTLFKEDKGSGRHATELWVLLYHHDAIRKEVRYELSLPSDFRKKNIIGWTERILLGHITEAPSILVKDIETSPPIEVFVEPKTGT